MSAHLMSVMSQVVKYDNNVYDFLNSEWLLGHRGRRSCDDDG